jgi:DNA-binding IclR family transcriptional regulator
MVKSAQRTLEVLELFEKLRRPVRVSEIAKLLRYPQSSTSVLVNSLRRLGYLNFDPDTHSFAPSIRMALMGGYLTFDGVDSGQILDMLSSVRDRTGCATILSTRNNQHLQYVYTLDAPSEVLVSLTPGALRPLTRSAAGIVLLTKCGEAEVGRILRRWNARREADDRDALASVLAEIEAARESGHAFLLRRLEPTMGSLAVLLPFRDSFGKPLAVSISGSADRMERVHEDLLRIIHEEILRRPAS